MLCVCVREREVCECDGKGKDIIFVHENRKSDQRLKVFAFSLSLFIIFSTTPIFNFVVLLIK